KFFLWADIDERDRNGRLTFRDRQLDAEVAVQTLSGALGNDDVLNESNFIENTLQSVLLGFRMYAPVPLMGQQLVRGLFSIADNPVTPRRRGSTIAFRGAHRL